MIQCYQYVPLIKAKALSRLIPKILKLGSTIIADIEDSVQDTLAPENTPHLKAQARDGLAMLQGKLPLLFEEGRIGVRINAMDTPEYALDVEAIGNLPRSVNWNAIWLPMVESPEMIARCRSDFAAAGIPEINIIPIIETVEGVRNLPTILEHKADYSLKAVHYGHYDYSLDAGHWPFFRQDNEEFWSVVSPIIRLVEDHECLYVHTPLGELNNEQLYSAVSEKLKAICDRPFARTALNIGQSQQCRQPSGEPFKWKTSRALDDEQRLALAHETVEAFRAHRCSRRSFSVHATLGEFITPHEYKAACRYLKNNGCDV